jgi:hypothetical protein
MYDEPPEERSKESEYNTTKIITNDAMDRKSRKIVNAHSVFGRRTRAENSSTENASTVKAMDW